MMRWDAKKKKYVKAEQDGDSSKKKIKTESGVWIPASYKSDRYSKWRERSKLEQQLEAEQEENDDEKKNMNRKRKQTYNGLPSGHPAMKKAQMAVPKHKKGPKFELQRPEQILKQRKIQAKNDFKNKKKSKKGNKKR